MEGKKSLITGMAKKDKKMSHVHPFLIISYHWTPELKVNSVFKNANIIRNAKNIT